MHRYPPALSAGGEGPRVRPASPGSSASRSSRPISSSSRPDDEDDRRRPHARKGSLPLYSGAAGVAAGRVLPSRGGRLRWVLVAALVTGALLWYYRAAELVEAASIPRQQEDSLTPTTKAAAAPMLEAPKQQQKDAKAATEALKLPPPPTVQIVDVDVRSSLAETEAEAESSPSNGRYLAYSPHSGYHNQRMSLENALTLAFMLDRTLLLPPVWVGHAIPYISFDKLGRRLEMATKVGLERCQEFGEGGSEDPIPRECEGYWSWTQVAWEFLVDLKKAKKIIPIKERWNQTEAWLEEELQLMRGRKGQDSPDVYRLKDETMYQYRFYDSPSDDSPLAKFENRVDLDKFAEDTAAFKLLHVGSLFGTSRIRTTLDRNFDARSIFRRAMVFKNPLVDEITAEIRDRLGGEGKYYGLHLRVGDGVFQKEAEGNMRAIWETLCRDKMKLEPEVCEEAARTGDGERLERRSDSPSTSTAASSPSRNSASSPSLPLSKRANSRPQRAGAFKHAPLPPLPLISSISSSPLSSSLTCRGPLHTKLHLLAFNTPLFLATDSSLPHSDPHLALFFRAFPCTFTLSDFPSSSLPALRRLEGWRNKEDKTPLAQFMYPQLDAQIAAWGRGLIGTPGSTYSRFAVDVLYQVYHGWEIVERG